MAQGMFEQYIEEIAQRVEAAANGGKRPVVVGIDGMAASGKTTLAALLAERLDAAVIHMDDFFLPQGFRTPKRLKTPGGNVYYERFCDEVKPYLRSGQLFGYRVFDAHQHRYTDTRDVWPKPVIIVEGCYCMHPEIGDIYDLRLFAEVSPYEQEKRIAETRGAHLEMYKAMWIPMENRYHNAFRIQQQCDMVIRSGAPQPMPPLEIERKWLIRMPNMELLREKAERIIDMEQVYLTGGAPGVSMRVRKSAEGDKVTYHRNEKQRLSDTVRIEREEEIDEKHYNILLGFANPTLRKIEKTRYCVPIGGGLTAEIDVFPFWSDRAFCEVELPHEHMGVLLPHWLDVVREVSADRRYTNLALAREIPMEDLL